MEMGEHLRLQKKKKKKWTKGTEKGKVQKKEKKKCCGTGRREKKVRGRGEKKG